MPGAMPNPSKDQRERKYGWTTLPAEPDNLPPPPPVSPGHTARGIELWGAWWSSPVALMWAPLDAIALERCLDLYETMWASEPSAAMLAEVRQIEDRFGLSPMSRRKLYWQIEGVDTDSKRPAAGKLAAVRPLERSDPRKR